MTIDVQSLRGALRELRSDVAALNRRVEAVEQLLADAGPDASASAALQLPPEIVVAHPDAVAEYLQTRPALAMLVKDMAPAILAEFANEPAQVVLDLYQDPEIDDRYMVYYVRLPDYPEELMDRLRGLSEYFAADAMTTGTDEWVLVTTDYHDPV